MASLLNSIHNGAHDFSGKWDDIKDYVATRLTLRAPVDANLTLQWASTPRNIFPNEQDIIFTEHLHYAASGGAMTVEYPQHGRWFRLLYENLVTPVPQLFADLSINLQTLYKGAATWQRIIDDRDRLDNDRVVSEREHALGTILTDLCGHFLTTTGTLPVNNEDDDNELENGIALYVTGSDGSASSYGTTRGSGHKLSSMNVAWRDSNNQVIDVTSKQYRVAMSNTVGVAQASTGLVADANTSGVALYLALSDSSATVVSSTETHYHIHKANAKYVTLADSSGNAFTHHNPMAMEQGVEFKGIKAFTLERGIDTSFVTYSDLSFGKINLFNFCAYNDGPTVAWVKLYDASSFIQSVPDSSVVLHNGLLRYNLAVPPGQVRDITLPHGTLFHHGLHFRAATQHWYDSVLSPGIDTIFVGGSYVARHDQYVDEIPVSRNIKSQLVSHARNARNERLQQQQKQEAYTFPPLPSQSLQSLQSTQSTQST